MANGTTQVLTAALLIVPVLLMCRDWMPKWIHRVPFTIVSIAIIFRIFAFWTIDLTDSQVGGYLPEDVFGFATILHIFDGPSGLMLGLLLGFSAGIALALITTVVGLIITVPFIFFYQFFLQKIEHFILELERMSYDIIHFCQSNDSIKKS